MNIAKLVKLTQKELLKELVTILIEGGYEGNILHTDDYIYARGEIPIMLVAHLDTVHVKKVESVFYDKEQDVMWSPEGIGGDDRCGVFAILKIIERGFLPYVLFTTEEEKGGIGAKKFCEQYQFDLADEIKYMIEIDRKGNNEAIFYRCGNKEFQNYVLGFGFTRGYGTFTDISYLSPAYDIASVNLSSGYYNPHTTSEYIKLGDLVNTINKIESMLKDSKNAIWYDYQETAYNYSYPQTTTPAKNTQTATQNKTDEKKDETETDKSVYLNMEADWIYLTEKEFLEWYGVKKPAKRSDVWNIKREDIKC